MEYIFNQLLNIFQIKIENAATSIDRCLGKKSAAWQPQENYCKQVDQAGGGGDSG